MVAASALRSRLARRRQGRPAGIVRNALRSPRGRAGALLIVLVAAIATIGPFVAPHSPTELITTPYAPPGTDGLVLGGDGLGRDAFSRVLCGGWALLLLALAATALGVVAGALAGMVAAYRQGWPDSVIMRTTDVFLSVPALVFGLLLVSIVGPYLWLVVFAVALTHAPQVARVIRAAAIEIAERDYVKAAELRGYSSWNVITREILPNLTTPLLVEAGLRLSYSIIIISGLSYLGFGQQPPAADWGQMINENRLGLGTNPWPVFVPCVLIALLAIGTNTFADAIARVSLGIDRGEATVLRATAASAIEPGVGDG